MFIRFPGLEKVLYFKIITGVKGSNTSHPYRDFEATQIEPADFFVAVQAVDVSFITT
jgi:hypothetical protein